jgi:hypothetical protein
MKSQTEHMRIYNQMVVGDGLTLASLLVTAHRF